LELPALSPSACFALLADTRYKFIRFFHQSEKHANMALQLLTAFALLISTNLHAKVR
jgi:hypothetical protein